MIAATYQLLITTCSAFIRILLIRLPYALITHIRAGGTYKNAFLLIASYWLLFLDTTTPAWQLHLAVCHLLFIQIRLRLRSEA